MNKIHRKITEHSELIAIAYKDRDSLMGVLALSAQSVVEALAGAALHPHLGRLLVSMETAQSGLEPCDY